MNSLAKLTWVETKLAFRDWGTVTFGLLFPAVLLVVLASVFPGFRDPDPNLGGARLVDVYAPIMLVLALVMMGISSLANVLATYRHDGVLRRLRTTPVGPSSLLVGQLIASLVAAVLGVGLAVVVAVTVLDVPAPASWTGTIVGMLLAATAMIAVGSLIGALASSTSAANAMATVVWLPIMVLAGLWFPRDAMPETMRRISDLSPGGAGVDAVQQAWFGDGATLSSLTVLAVFTLVVGGIASVAFRWD